MEQLPTGEPRWNLFFDANGILEPRGDQDALPTELAARGVSDVFIFSHGWNNSEEAASGLYDVLFPLLGEAVVEGMPHAVPGFVGVFWPSLWFPETPATVDELGGDIQAGWHAAVDRNAGTDALSGAEIAASLADGFDGLAKDTVKQLGQLIDVGQAALAAGAPETDQVRRLETFRDLIAGLVPSMPPEESGDGPVLFTGDPVVTYRQVAEAFGTVPPGSDTQDVGSTLRAAFAGAKDVLRLLSYRTMKARAGTIGTVGLGPLLASWHRASTGTRVHLMGHSFGARLASYALAGVGAADSSPVASLILIQGAFSHWAFAHTRDNPFGKAGPLSGFTDRVHGALAATFSAHDRAVCLWYPTASFLSGDDTQAVSTASRWGAMGADGFQAVSPANDLVLARDGSLDTPVASGGFHRVDANGVIKDETESPFSGAHSDIKHPSLARFAVSVASVSVPVTPSGSSSGTHADRPHD